MDRTTASVISRLETIRNEHLSALGDNPKAESFDHGVQVGVYRGIKVALKEIERVLNDEIEEEARR